LNNIAVKILFVLFFVSVYSTATAGVIASDTVWKGEVLISEDILIPEGITLTVMPGTIIKVAPSESTKTEPEYMSHLTEITVRGTLKAEGTEGSPVVFIIKKENRSDSWAGLIIDGGTADLRWCRIQDAETGIYAINGVINIEDSIIRGNHYGFVAQGEKTVVNIKNTLIEENDYGIFTLSGAKVDINTTIIKDNRKKDIYSHRGKDHHSVREYNPPFAKGEIGGSSDVSRKYGDDVLLGNTIWQGRIEIDGIIRVPEGSRLVILPGSVIEFKKKDTNGDGIGENGLLIQGVIIAKGTGENPIIFRSAEKQKRMGDWDAINIMNSDGAQNLIEYCKIEDAYRGLHFHFSNAGIKESVLRNNYRGIQFQESAVEISRTYIYGNKSGLQARDSEIILTDNYIYNNYSGVNLFRTNVSVRGNKVVNNYRDGLRLREGIPVVEENLIDGNRYGIMVFDSVYGSFIRNVISNNLESGLSLKGADNLEIGGNFISGNGFNGINLQDSSAVIRGNHISWNGERGIGIISFDGIITENNIVKNGAYALGLDGEKDVSAPMNWFGSAVIEDVIYDRNDEPRRGRVEYNPARKDPVMYLWPLKTINADTIWDGEINIKNTIQVLSGATLELSPGTKVLFSEGAGLKINGKIIARGEKDSRIIFTSLKKNGPSDWDEIFLEHATDSIFSNCDFEHATWGIHSHFTNLLVTDCNFRKNYGGIRFQSGPVEIRHSFFKGNTIGLRSFRGSAVIAENVFTENEIGIFVREKGRGLTIKRNNLFANSGYNIRLGDFNDEDVDARENYWGDSGPVNTIFDGRIEPGIGIVNYEPYSKEPFRFDSGNLR